MTTTATMEHVDPATGEVTEKDVTGLFNLEPSTPGTVPQGVVDELCRTKTIANDYAQAFGDAVKAQAEKHQVKPGALRRYISALVGDKIEEAEAEAEDLTRLIEAGQ